MADSKGLFNFQSANNLLGGPYTYGNLGLTSSDYSVWGSKGNPYTYSGPTYTPGSGTPLVPQPITSTPTAPVGGDDSFPDTSVSAEEPWYSSPSVGLYGGLLTGRFDLPGGEYARLPWYEGSAGGGYGYTEEGYDQYAPGDTDRGIYDAATGERTWGEEFDDYNTGDLWAYTGPLEGIQNLFETGNWEGYIEPTYDTPTGTIPDRWGDPTGELAQEAAAAIAQDEQAKVDAAQAEIDKIAGYTNMLQSEFDAQLAAQEDLNAEQLSLMYEIKDDMQRDFGDFSTETSSQMAQIAAENAAMFDSIEEYREWQLDTETHQQAWLENEFKDQAAAQQALNEEQKSLMDTIAMDMQKQYGEFTGETGKQLAEMAAQNASMFDSYSEYMQWMGDEFTTLESGLNEQLAQQAAITEGLNESQVSLMNDIAADMRATYGDFATNISGQLEQMAAENASMFDSLAEYQEWMAEEEATAPASPQNPPPSTLEEALEQKVPFGQEGDKSWSPDGQTVYHSKDYDWNADGGSDYSDPGSASDSDMAEAGFSQEDQDFIDSGFDDSDSGGGDSGGGGGSYIATAATQALGEEGLKVFEDWRDFMHQWHPTFTTSYGRYRVTAPKIVAEIDKKDNATALYKDIWDKHLKPIYDIIVKDKRSIKALSDYKIMVRELQNEYLKGDK